MAPTLKDIQDTLHAAEATLRRAEADLAQARRTKMDRMQELSDLATRLRQLKAYGSVSSEFLEVQAMHRMASAGTNALDSTVARYQEQVQKARVGVDQAHWQLNEYINSGPTPAEKSRRRREERKAREERRKVEREQEERRRFEEWRRNAKGEKSCYEGGLGPAGSQQPGFPNFDERPYRAWKAETDAAFKNYAAIKEFPAPPAISRCGNAGCEVTEATRVLEACPCSIRRAFEVLSLVPKDERLKWHPDRFSRCREEKREEYQQKAKEVFQVIEKMYVESKK